MNYYIREMTMDDYDEAFSLWEDTEGIGVNLSDSRDSIASYLDRNPGLSFVAYADSKLVGTVLCGHDARRGYLNHLAVNKRYRGEGIGRALVEACLSVLRELGIWKCNAFIYSDNHEGKLFWKQNGWFSRDDLDVMQKVVKE